ncbi:MAG TPA: methyltransferase [Rhizomicrobium sp.]|nr:methyltransferase [Rhizomicrobium sp.]
MTETFLDGKVRVAQPESGFRSGLDAVMLAAAVPAQAGQTALELGAGAGTASLCLLARVPGVVLTGVEIDKNLAALARDNAAANGVQAAFVSADIFALPSELKRDFDQVFCNPPFHGEGQVSPDVSRAAALMDGGGWPTG